MLFRSSMGGARSVSIFDFVTVAVSLILGLGITRLLESAIEAFRRRSEVELHWLPFAWALTILVLQLQFWWAIYALQVMDSITILEFVLLLALTLLLFVAGALVLPSGDVTYPENLMDYFARDGVLGVAAAGTYHLVAIAANVVWFSQAVATPFIALGLTVGVLGVVIAFVRSHSWLIGLSVIWILLTVVSVVLATPANYSTF